MSEVEAGAVAPVENALTPDAPATPAPAVTPDPPTDTGDEAKPKKGRFQERISELTAARRKAEEEARYWRDQAVKAQDAPPPKPPTLADVDGDFDKLTEAQNAYMAQGIERAGTLALAKIPEVQAQRTVERVDAEYQAALAENWQARVAEAKKDPNWEKVALRTDLPVDQSMGEYIQSADRGPELLFHLGQNPALAAQIQALPTTQKIAELVRLELSLTAPKAKPVSNAPPPPSPVGGDIEGSGEDPEKMSPDQWRVWRSKQIRRR